MSAPSLFGEAAERGGAPLAARMRPRTLEEYVGQRHLLDEGRPLRSAIRSGAPGSMILWGPPGVGKTTLAHLIAAATDQAFVPFSAVSEGVPRIREVVEAARLRLEGGDRRTILFVDEIHRLNKGQQDALLPPVEHGVVTLIGATTENPSFALNAALLSRARVFVLEPLTEADVRLVVDRALADPERGLARQQLAADPEALDWLAATADGDARRALTVLEAAVQHAGLGGRLSVEVVREALQRRVGRHDKAGEEHFNLLSAYHKSLRGSDPQGALYWMARMLEGGEDPLVLFRRATAMAAEDIGLADPQALQVAVAARQAYEHLGAPEGYLPLAEMTIYLATAPKSNRAKVALDAALAAARETPAAPVPLHLRNAPTRLMRDLGYGAGYRYAHDHPGGHAPQQHLPDALAGRAFYEPGELGFEKTVRARMAWWAARAAGAEGGEGSA